jgi:polyhydroxyalkanoate synthase
MSAAMETETESLASRVQKEVERALQRNIKGLEYFTSSGPAVGETPRDLLHQRGTMALYRYRPQADELYRVPLLIVMALTNRGYILDLAPGQSFVGYLLERGYDVYMIDWNPPRPDEKRLRLENYTLDFIPDAIARVQRASGEQDVNLLGYCMGGVLSTVYAALHADGPVRNLALFTTPIDFGQMMFAKWSDRRHFDVDKLVDTLGNAPPELIYEQFAMLRPADRFTEKVKLWDNLWNDEFVKSYRRFDRWGADVLPLPGEFVRQLVKEVVWEGRLVKNELVVGGRRVDLGNITIPVLHVVAEHDHIVTYGASKPLIENVGSKDKEEVILKGGHVSIAAGANAVKRMWPKLDSWLGERST